MEALLEVALLLAAVVMLSAWVSRVGRRGRHEETKGATERDVRPARSAGAESEAALRPVDFAAIEETPLGRRMSRPAQMTRVLKGRAHVIDGDTVVIRGTKIRLAGIDAPELDQPYGNKAKWAMVEICRDQVVAAHPTGDMSHDRIVATCHLSDGTDIGAELSRRGLALDWPLFSGGRYRHLECPLARRRILNGRRWHRSRAPEVRSGG